ncbi:MAG TPA: transglycosylase domain-containing protein [Acidimicrobiales bacterium]|nr:transglycosylase domain-containing protein [Acidimicrobiales bacterium]
MNTTHRALATATAVVLVLAALVPVGVSAVVAQSLLSPPALDELPDARPQEGSQLSRVYDVHGEEIAVFREFDQRVPIKPSDVPEILKQAVVSVEDRSFYSNRGIDLSAMVRALIADVKGGEVVQGGSTITQQYVKNVYVGRERTVKRKIQEAVLAQQLNRMVDKDEILFRYLNEIYLGQGAIGVGAASRSYFRKPVNELDASEAALLAALIPAPSRYEPRGNPAVAESRRVLVLDAMHGQGYLTDEEHEEAVDREIWLAERGEPPRPSTVVYPLEDVVSEYPYFVDYVRRYLEDKYGERVYAGGLEVHTTLDPRIQDMAEAAVAEALGGTQPPIEMALASVDPRTGFVAALVGGRDFQAPGGQVNLALGNCPAPPPGLEPVIDVPAACWDPDAVYAEGGGTGRQPGSSWKPFVLATALDQGMPESTVYSAPSEYRVPGCTGDRGCTVQNYEGSAGGQANLREATAQSYNTVYAQLIRDVGIPEVGEMAKRLGITSAWVANPEVHGISYALGVQEVAPLEMASAYGVFANAGQRQPPTPVTFVEGPDGEMVEDNRDRAPERVLDERVAANVTDILKGVISGGTGTAADIARPAAGKTGTAQEWRDAWFVGYTPTLSTAVWIGNKEKPTSLFNIKGVNRVTGGSIPAKTWNAFMTAALEGVPPDDFPQPPPAPAPPTVPTVAPPPTVATTPPPTEPTTTLPLFTPPPLRSPTTSQVVPRNTPGQSPTRPRPGFTTTTTTAPSTTTTTSGNTTTTAVPTANG